MTKTLLVGMCPSKEPGPAFTGRAGARLANLCGRSLYDFLWSFDRVNLFDEPRVPWPRQEAPAAAEALLRAGALDAYHRVILVGRPVERAFDMVPLPHTCWPTRCDWFDWRPFEWEGRAARATAAVAPHPSGLSHYWNEPANVRAAERFWHEAVRVSEAS